MPSGVPSGVLGGSLGVLGEPQGLMRPWIQLPEAALDAWGSPESVLSVVYNRSGVESAAICNLLLIKLVIMLFDRCVAFALSIALSAGIALGTLLTLNVRSSQR